MPEFTVVDHIPRRLERGDWDYPKAGDPNPGVKLASSAPRRRAGVGELDRYAPRQHPDRERQLDARQQPRRLPGAEPRADVARPEQRRRSTAATRRRCSARPPRPGSSDNGAPTWLKDGSFLWVSERSGWKHIYHYKRRRHAGAAGHHRRVGSAHVPRRRRAGDGPTSRAPSAATSAATSIASSSTARGLTRLSRTAGTHGATLQSGLRALPRPLERPPHARRRCACTQPTARRARVVESNKSRDLAECAWCKPEFLQVKTRDGFAMEAMLVQPAELRASRKVAGDAVHLRRPVRAAGGATMGRPVQHVHQLLAAQRHRRVDLRQPLRQRQGRQSAWTSTSTSASRSCATSRTASPGCKQAAVGRRQPLRRSTAGATAASWPPTR